MKKIAILGGNGQLATFLKQALGERHYVKSFSRKELDITKPIQKDFFRGFDAIINCAAFTNTKLAEVDKANYEINFEGVKNLYNSITNQFFIHISSLSVFKPTKNFNKELDFIDSTPNREYDKAKRLADLWLHENAKNFLVIRPSWLISSGPTNFINKMDSLNLDKYRVVNDDIGQITSGEMVLNVVEHSLRRELRGFINVASNDVINRFEMLKIGFAAIGNKGAIEQVSSDEIGFDISNIKFQWMDVTKYNKIFGKISAEKAIREWGVKEWKKN